MSKTYYRALTIAGSDSGGGAGIQADLKTFSALGCYGMSVLTALTAQNTVTVSAIHSVPTPFIAAQIDAVLTDIGTDAVKIGMLHSPEVIETVTERLHHHQTQNIVLDPVMVAKSGDKLLQDDAVDALRELLVPHATIITPNLPEASVFLGRSIQEQAEMKKACLDLAKLGPKAVLSGNQSGDLLYVVTTDQFFHFDSSRIETGNTHGTGCTLSSAITAYLAQGNTLHDAVGQAKTYITAAITAGAEYNLGKGHGPVHHFHQFWSTP